MIIAEKHMRPFGEGDVWVRVQKGLGGGEKLIWCVLVLARLEGVVHGQGEKALGHNIKSGGEEQACARGVRDCLTDSIDRAACVRVAQPWAEAVPDNQFFPQDQLNSALILIGECGSTPCCPCIFGLAIGGWGEAKDVAQARG